MRRFGLAIAAVLVFVSLASNAKAAAIWSVSATTSDGAPLDSVSPGAQIILDITLRTTDRAFSIAGSVNDYDNSLVAFNAGASSISPNVLNSICIPGTGCFGGLANQVGSAIPLQENAVGPGVEVEFLAAVSLSAAGGSGALDEGVVTGVAGDPQFRLVFDWIGGFGTTVLNIGTFAEYLDGYQGTIDSDVSNTSVAISVVPEPGTALLIALGLLGLAGGRRR